MRSLAPLCAMACAALLACGCGNGGEEGTGEQAAPRAGELPRQAVLAAQEGDAQRMKDVLNEAPDLVRATDSGGKTLLYYAALHGNEAAVEVLLRNGSDPNVASDKGIAPLYWAAKNGHETIVRQLLAKRADVHAATPDGHTPLHAAIDHRQGIPRHDACVRIARMLLARKARPNARTADGDTPLHVAARYGHADLARMLLESGAHASAENAEGQTPLGLAQEIGHQDVAALLREHGG
ncbi:MAG: ankyrin repeat domain-containing protein [Candidatus Brocadiia bacterium]